MYELLAKQTSNPNDCIMHPCLREAFEFVKLALAAAHFRSFIPNYTITDMKFFFVHIVCFFFVFSCVFVMPIKLLVVRQCFFSLSFSLCLFALNHEQNINTHREQIENERQWHTGRGADCILCVWCFILCQCFFSVAFFASFCLVVVSISLMFRLWIGQNWVNTFVKLGKYNTLAHTHTHTIHKFALPFAEASRNSPNLDENEAYEMAKRAFGRAIISICRYWTE